MNTNNNFRDIIFDLVSQHETELGVIQELIKEGNKDKESFSIRKLRKKILSIEKEIDKTFSKIEHNYPMRSDLEQMIIELKKNTETVFKDYDKKGRVLVEQQ